MRSYWALALCLAMVAGSLFVLSSCSKPQEELPVISAPIAPPPAPAAEESEAAESAAVEEESESAATEEQEAVIEVSYGEDETLKVRNLADFDFRGVDIVLSSPGASVSAVFAPKAAAAGAVVIDNTSKFRMEPDVPLVVPEVNPGAIAGYGKRGIIANPNCSTMQMLVALAPLHRQYGIERINVATYQSVSGAGRSAPERSRPSSQPAPPTAATPALATPPSWPSSTRQACAVRKQPSSGERTTTPRRAP